MNPGVDLFPFPDSVRSVNAFREAFQAIIQRTGPLRSVEETWRIAEGLGKAHTAQQIADDIERSRLCFDRSLEHGPSDEDCLDLMHRAEAAVMRQRIEHHCEAWFKNRTEWFQGRPALRRACADLILRIDPDALDVFVLTGWLAEPRDEEAIGRILDSICLCDLETLERIVASQRPFPRFGFADTFANIHHDAHVAALRAEWAAAHSARTAACGE